MSPTLSVVAGPNGSGKSTLTSSIWFEGNSNLIGLTSTGKESTARVRLNLLHELGHLILHRDLDRWHLENKSLHKMIESQAFKFAGAFALPAESYGADVYSCNAVIVQLGCSHCGHVYGANSTDVWERLCPVCQDGKPGSSYEEMPEIEQSVSDVTRAHQRGRG